MRCGDKRRHPELGLTDTTNMTYFLRHPLTPGIFRGFQIGGNAFSDSLRGLSQHPAGKPWRDDQSMPVLDTSGEHPQPTREVRDAAYESRKLNETMSPSDLRASNITNVAARYSSGCPICHLYFRTDEASLVAQNLSLVDSQLKPLLAGEQPFIRKIDDSHYSIERDSLAIMSHLLADALEVIAK